MTKYYTDGYTLLSNPSPAGGGFSIVNEYGELINHTQTFKKDFTNNEAEVTAIVHALEICKPNDIISSDSKTAITWINIAYSKTRKDLIPLLRHGKDLCTSKNISLIWEGRDFNLAGYFNERYDTGKPETCCRFNHRPKRPDS